MAGPRSVVFQGSQLGIQSALNSAASADIKLLAPGFSRIAAKSEGGYTHVNTGSRLPTAHVPPGYHEGDITFDGPIDFVCILYQLASYFGVPTPTPDGTNGQIWDFALALSTGVARTFYTYENGDTTRAEKAINAYCNSLVFESSKMTQKYSGTLKCAKKQRGQTLTGSPTEVPPVLAFPQSFNLFAASSKSALDTAVSTDDKLLTPAALGVLVTFPDVATPQPRMNSAEDSYFAVNDKLAIPTFQFTATDEDDIDAFCDLIDTSATQFFALQCLGDVIAGATPSKYELRIDFCGGLIEPETSVEDHDAVGSQLTFQNEYDSTWGQAHNVRVVTTIDDLQPV